MSEAKIVEAKIVEAKIVEAVAAWRQAETELVEAITKGRSNGVTWQTIAEALGVSNRASALRWHDRRR